MRLERLQPERIHVRSCSFQFHKGAIRTVECLRDRNIEILFQFHKGAIRTYQFNKKLISDFHFNSIKVRLERYIRMNADTRLHHFNSIKVRLEPDLEGVFFAVPKFQFHKGAIRTCKSG